MSKDRVTGADCCYSLHSIAATWCFVVFGLSLAAAWSIEHPEFLSMPPVVLGVIVSGIFVGLPLALGLSCVQAPAFHWSLSRNPSLRRAWAASIIANSIYAAMLTAPLMMLGALLGNEISTAIAIRGAVLLVLCSFVTSAIWLGFNELMSRGKHG